MIKPAIDSQRWFMLILLCAAQFMVVLDFSIVNVALPSIQGEFEFSQQNLQWVVNAYTLAFGGFLLLGGRAADLLGRRRVFIVGLGLFSLASLTGGFAQAGGVLLAARAVQGLGAALISPAALSMVTTIFAEGPERNRAFGAWGATGGAGIAAGVLLGGVLTDTLGWEWVMFVNVPIGVVAALLGSVLLRESRITMFPWHFDLAGAISVTTGLVVLVFAVVGVEAAGWGSVQTISLLTLSVILLVGFVFIEMRSKSPLVPLRIFRLRNLTVANLVSLIHATGPLSTMFFISLYLQQVLGFSALASGLAFLPFALMTVVSSGLASRLVNQLGVKPVLVSGLLLMAIGLLLFAQLSVGSTYVSDVLPASLIIAVGSGLSFVPLTIAAITCVRTADTGLASGLINTTQQIGAALVLALLVTIASTRTEAVIAARGSSPQVLTIALTEGFESAFLLGTALLVAGACVALLVSRQRQIKPSNA